MFKSEDNPDGVEEGVLEEMVAGLSNDRPKWATAIANPWFGNGLPGVSVSQEMLGWGVGLFLQASPKAAIDMLRASFATDLRPDTRALDVPTLIVHGDSDVMVPFEVSGRRVAEAVPHGELKVYKNASHGLFISRKERLNGDLLAFVEGVSASRAGSAAPNAQG